MPSITKTLAKRILPQIAIEAVLRRREKRALDLVPDLDFEPSALIASTLFDHSVIFAAQSPLDSDWEADHGAIVRQATEGRIGSAVSAGDRRALYRLVRHFQPKSVLEFGTHLGMSTYYLAQALARNGAGRITTVDIIDVNGDGGAWRQAGLKMPPAEIAKALGLSGHVEFVAEPSTEFMAGQQDTYDLIFLDGDHAASAVYREVAWALGRLNPGGQIILHDYFPNGTRLFPDLQVVQGPYLAFDRLSRENPSIGIVPFSPLPWTTMPGTNNTSLAALVRM
ncbi:MAG: class I SAM-dependent methyltransferase [Paracoccaceae bacterium]|nr:class I SAM-dependent methyltransferase [Paracoccaceae bacterium]